MRNIIKEIISEWKREPDYYIFWYNRILATLVMLDVGVRHWA